MRTKVIRVRVDSETENQIKNRAGSEGKSMAGIIRSFIEKSLDSGRTSVPAIEPEAIRKALETAGLDEVKTGIRDLARVVLDLREEGQSSGASPGYPWTKEQVRHLVYTLARLDKFFTVYNAAWGKNDANVGTRARVANEAGDRAVQEYGLGDVDRVRIECPK